MSGLSSDKSSIDASFQRLTINCTTVSLATPHDRREGKRAMLAVLPSELKDSDLFCEQCLETTTNEGLSVVPHGQLQRAYDTCEICGSVMRDYYVVVFWLPIFHVASFRVKQHDVPQLAEPSIAAMRKLPQ